MRTRSMIGLGLCCVVVVTACGSQVPPGQYYGGPGRAAAATPTASDGVVGAADIVQSSAAAAISGSAAPGVGGATLGATGPGGGPATSGAPAAVRSSQPPATSGVTAGSCAGFHNGTGISSSAISVSNVADLTGPVSGLFTSAQQAALAYAAYFNSTSAICGRKLKVVPYDSQTSEIGDQEADTSACASTFAMVGSIGAFDAGGVGVTTQCGIPDLRALATNPQRANAPTTFGTDAAGPEDVSTSQYRLIKSRTGNAAAKSAMLYLDAGASTPNALAYEQTMKHVGYSFVYTQGIGVTEFNYAPYVAQMKKLGVTLVQFEGSYQFAVRLKQAMDGQDLHPVFVMDSVAYDPVFVQAGGSSIDGMYSYVDTALLEEAARSPELRLYESWLQRVAPGAKPTFYGMFAWGSMALFAQLATQLGGKLTRSSLLAAVRGVHAFSDHGLFAPQDVGAKKSSPCQAVIQLEHSTWMRRSPYPYSCNDVFHAVAS